MSDEYYPGKYIPGANNLGKLLLDVAYKALVLPSLSETESWFKLDSWFKDRPSKREKEAVIALAKSIGYNDRFAGELLQDYYNKSSVAGTMDLDTQCDLIPVHRLIEFVLTSEFIDLDIRRVMLQGLADHEVVLKIRSIYKYIHWFADLFHVDSDIIEFLWHWGFKKHKFGSGAYQTTRAGVNSGAFRICDGDRSIVPLSQEKILKHLHLETHSLERLFLNSENHKNWSKFSSYCSVLRDIACELRSNTGDVLLNNISALRGRYSGDGAMLHNSISNGIGRWGSGYIGRNALIAFNSFIEEHTRYIVGSLVDRSVDDMASVYTGLFRLFVTGDELGQSVSIGVELNTAMHNYSFYDPANQKIQVPEMIRWINERQAVMDVATLYA